MVICAIQLRADLLWSCIVVSGMSVLLPLGLDSRLNLLRSNLCKYADWVSFIASESCAKSQPVNVNLLSLFLRVNTYRVWV